MSDTPSNRLKPNNRKHFRNVTRITRLRLDFSYLVCNTYYISQARGKAYKVKGSAMTNETENETCEDCETVKDYVVNGKVVCPECNGAYDDPAYTSDYDTLAEYYG